MFAMFTGPIMIAFLLLGLGLIFIGFKKEDGRFLGFGAGLLISDVIFLLVR